MHVKQLTTSQAFPLISRKKSKCVSRRKSFTSFVSRKSDRRWQESRDLQVSEVTGQLFAYSTNLLQHVTVYEQYRRRPAGGAAVSWTHVNPLNRTPRWLWFDYSYVLSDGVLWRWTTGGRQHTILYSLASEHNPDCTVFKEKQGEKKTEKEEKAPPPSELCHRILLLLLLMSLISLF